MRRTTGETTTPEALLSATSGARRADAVGAGVGVGVGDAFDLAMG
jgi:hypothetical protein